jgi:hypothetical protein
MSSRLLCSLALVPVVWLMLFGSFVLRARLVLGHWPAPYRPDPKDLGFDVHHAVLLVGMPLMFAAVTSLAGLSLVSYGRHRRAEAQLRSTAVVAALSLAIVIAVAHYDPGGLFTWLAD